MSSDVNSYALELLLVRIVARLTGGVLRDDFIKKVGIATKEASETEFWLELICESPHLQAPGSQPLLQESREILAILTTIGKRAKIQKH